jgi:hypothetical protein
MAPTPSTPSTRARPSNCTTTTPASDSPTLEEGVRTEVEAAAAAEEEEDAAFLRRNTFWRFAWEFLLKIAWQGFGWRL